MLQGLGTYISQALADNQEALSRNPQLANQLQAKITMLQRPVLQNEIIEGRFWIESSAASSNGRTIPIVAVFPLESMRSNASQAVQTLERVLPLLETFMEIPFPTSSVRVWYGFIIGNKSSGGTIYTEDRTTYDLRWTPMMVPHDAILGHELAHNYIGHEGLTQFLEVYVYNVAQTGSMNMALWSFTRNYIPSSTESVHALLDVYSLIGRDRMAAAYNGIYALRPPYGEPLSMQSKQVFIDQAPANVRDQVGEAMSRVVY